MKKYIKIIKKVILQLLVVCMTVGLVTAKTPVYATEEPVEEEIIAEVLCEDVDSREESIKYFNMSDRSTKAIVYSMPVHYQEDGEWKEIDNTLIDDGLEDEEETIIEETVSSTEEIDETDEVEVSNNEVEEIAETSSGSESDQVTGYKNRQGKYNIKFSKKAHAKNMVSFSDGDYKVTWGFSSLENRSAGVVSENTASEDIYEKVLGKITQEIVYSDVMDGVNLVYDIDSLSIKENIVITKSQDNNEFTFEYKVNKLELELNDEGEIVATNSDGEVIFVMPKPFMYDSEGVYCDDVHYEMTRKNKKYTVTIVANEEWMNDEDRAYPITIDPVIKTETTKSAIDSTFVTSDQATTNHSDKLELLVGKEKSEYGNCRTLVKFTLPELNRGDMMIDAQLNIALYKYSFYASTTPSLRINADMVTGSWEYNTVTWNTCPSFESTVLDYEYITRDDVMNEANWKQFDITRAVKKWYNGTANNGIILKSYTESGTYAETGVKGYLWPERYNSTTKSYPYIALTYRNNKGLEDYWDFSTVSTTSAGEININTYSGNPVVIHDDASTQGSRLPITVSHIYNGYMAGANVSNIKPYAGKGWKLNIQQTIRPSTEYGLSGDSAEEYPYVYMDEDGTEHYFKVVDSQYLDEDGLGLELKVTSSGYTITDESDTVMTFNSLGNVSKIEDANGNAVTYTYSGKYITKITDGSGQSITLTYNSSGYVTDITDPSGKTTLFTYDDGLLTTITYSNGKSSTYTYDSENSLSKMISTDGTYMQFGYTKLAYGKKVNKLTEYGRNGGEGQTVKFSRGEYNITNMTTSGADGQIGTDDDITTVMQYDDAGRLTATYSETDEKSLGASVASYTSSTPNSSNSNIKQLNRVSKTGSMSTTVHNLLVNHSGESLTSWSYSQSNGSATFTCASSSEESLFGQKSIKISTTASESSARSRVYQNITTDYIQPNTTYTASAYVKTKDIEAVEGADGAGAAIIVYMKAASIPTTNDAEAADYVSEYIIGTTDEKVNNGWRRISVTFTTPSDITLLRFNAGIRGATGTAYFDGLQIEEGNSANSYNMMENSSFERSTDGIADNWTRSKLTDGDVTATNVSRDGSYSMKIKPDAATSKQIYQDVAVNGKEEDTYIVSAWAYGKGLKRTVSTRQFTIGLRVDYSDGTYIYKTASSFNDSVYGWKYNAMTFDLSDGTSEVKTPVSVRIHLRSYCQANNLYFDDVQLIKKSVTSNTYDSDGNLKSSSGQTYTYTDGNLTSSTDINGITSEYTYDENDNLVSITDESGIENELVYDEYGNIVEENVTDSQDGLKIKTEAIYDSTGTYQLKSIDEDGKSTVYDYNISKGLLNSVTDANGNKTSYTYNDDGKTTKIESGNISNSISYNDNGQISSLSSDGAVYTFAYDEFNNLSSISIGGNTYVTYQYETYNGNLSSKSYSSYTEEYEYDEYGNVVEIYENENKIEYDTYDSYGNMQVSYDYKTNIKIKIDYDLEGRIIRISAYDIAMTSLVDSRLYEIEYGYDDNGKLIRQIDNNGGEVSITDYSYDDQMNTDKVTLDSSVSLSYDYDSLNRTASKTIDTTNSIKTEYTYADSLRGEGYTTNKIESEDINGATYTYVYDAIGNITQITVKRGTDTKVISYEYDNNSQLTRENNQQTGKTIVYTYDTAGNIQTKKEYAYTTGELGTVLNTFNYEYGNTQWKDQLTSYNGNTITYDAMGNPTSYLGYSMTWNGYELLSMNKGNDTIEYTYDTTGMRRTKTVNDSEIIYDYVGDILVHESGSNYDLYYAYDDNGLLVKLTYVKNGTSTEYYVTTNNSGDVEAIYSSIGVLQARYIYDTWGNTVLVLDGNGNTITDSTHIGNINPIRYRGYYLDKETGLYYLQARYYDASTGRFISADDTDYISEDILGTNIYAYCSNNPVMNSDPSGCLKIARDRLANWLDFFLGFLPLAGAFKPVESIVKKAIEHYGKSKLKDYLKKIFKKVISKSIINLFKGIIKLIKKKTIITAFMMVFIPKIGKTVAKLFLEDIKSLNATIIVNLLSKIGNMCIENIDIFFSAGSFIAGFFDYYSDKKLNGYITI